MLTVGAFYRARRFHRPDRARHTNGPLVLLLILLAAVAMMALLSADPRCGAAAAHAPALNTLLITLMAGTVLREAVAVLPAGRQSSRFRVAVPNVLPSLGTFNLRYDNVIMLAAGVAVIVARNGCCGERSAAIRAVAQDEETARSMASILAIVLITFAIGFRLPPSPAS